MSAARESHPEAKRSDRSGLLGLAKLIFLLAVALALAGVILLAADRSVPLPQGFAFRGYEALLGLSLGALGLLILRHQPRSRVGWLFLMQGPLNTLHFVSREYAVLALLVHPGLPAGAWAAWLHNWLWVPVAGGILNFGLLVFPNGQLPSRQWRPVVWLSALAILLAASPFALQPGPLVNDPYASNPLSLATPAVTVLFPVGLTLFGLSVLACASSLAVRYRRAAYVERQQLRAVAFAAIVMALTFSGNLFLSTLLLPLEQPTRSALPSGFALLVRLTDIAVILSIIGLPVAATVAILRYRLYDIDLLINRALVYGALSALLAGVYAAATLGSRQLFVALTGQTSDASTVLTTLAVVALFTPLKNRLQVLVDRYLEQPADPGEILGRLADELRIVIQASRSEQLLIRLLEQAAAAFEARCGCIYQGPSDRPHLLATLDRSGPEGAEISVPIEVGGHPHSTLALGRRRGGRAYSPSDRSALQGAAAMVGEALLLIDLRSTGEAVGTPRAGAGRGDGPAG